MQKNEKKMVFQQPKKNNEENELLQNNLLSNLQLKKVISISSSSENDEVNLQSKKKHQKVRDDQIIEYYDQNFKNKTTYSVFQENQDQDRKRNDNNLKLNGRSIFQQDLIENDKIINYYQDKQARKQNKQSQNYIEKISLGKISQESEKIRNKFEISEKEEIDITQTNQDEFIPSNEESSEQEETSNLEKFTNKEMLLENSSAKKKDKKLVFLSRSVLKSVRQKPLTTGTEIANEILELYKRFSDKVDFKNVQRRVYDALNVLSAMEIIVKDKNHITYNEDNEFIDDSVLPNTAPAQTQSTLCTPQHFSQKNQIIKLQNVAVDSLQSFDKEERKSELKKRLLKEQQKQQILREKLHKLQQIKNEKNEQKQNLDLKLNYQKKCIFELLKQYISLNRLIERNKQGSHFLEQIVPADEKYRQSFILVKFMPNTKIVQKWDENKLFLILEGNKPFEIMNENYLFEGMGISKFDSFDIDEYIGKTQFLETKEQQKLCQQIKTFLHENFINLSDSE